MPQIKQRIKSAKLMNSGEKVAFKQQAEGVFIYVENIPFDAFDTIIQLDTE